ncbi:MAG: hypothetical protein F6K23_27315 [Okeania sp. SIO2C9]|uniref:hypothetical protein n=1 Tax=Okeania sp. SIO2C9 TaxID=2607791 RepID=UPI0013BF180A|nr:hypothetical protein [Okeania sp. SIO2C9]NEQ76422.1 hypothetical protein [Okeania sp. SIO2C9]
MGSKQAQLLTLYTIVGKLNQKKCPWFYKLMLRAVASEELVPQSISAYNTIVSLVTAASQKGQMIDNAHVQNIETSQISSDEFWSFVQKKRVRNSGETPECKTHSTDKNTVR